MRTIQQNWIWIAVIILLLVAGSARGLSWYVVAAAFAAAGGYLLWRGWATWTRYGGGSRGSKVTYWRGQRIELAPERRGPSLPRMSDIGPALLPLLGGLVLVIGAVAVTLRAFGY